MLRQYIMVYYAFVVILSVLSYVDLSTHAIVKADRFTYKISHVLDVWISNVLIVIIAETADSIQ